MVFIKCNSLKSVTFFNLMFMLCFSGSMLFKFTFLRVQVYQSPGFSCSRFIRVQVFLSAGLPRSKFFRVHVFHGSDFLGSRFFRVQFFHGSGLSCYVYLGVDFSGSRFFRIRIFHDPGFPWFRSVVWVQDPGFTGSQVASYKISYKTFINEFV